MATKKPAPKKAAPAKTAKPAPAAKKPAPKPAAKAVPAKKAEPVKKAVPVKAAPATKTPAKPVAKAVPVKKEAPKPAAKAAPAKKKVAKTPAKPAPKAAPAKKEAPKPAAKAAPAKKEVSKTPTKPIAKPAPAKKEEVKTVASKKEVAKPAPAKKEVAKPKAVKAEAPKKAKAAKPAKEAPKKVIVAPLTVGPKKIDAFKTNTFAAANLKNESGKVIAHRKTSELKRKTEDLKPKKYIPELSRSILDMSNTNNTTSFRYSDEELQEFKELIQRKLDTAKAELQYLQGVIMRKDESGTEDTENKYQNMEDGSASMDREQLNQLASRQITFITHLEQAMVRIENKTYGICRETGKLIDKARLRAVPHATLSIEAKNAKK